MWERLTGQSAWMVASLLPLPVRPGFETADGTPNPSDLDLRHGRDHEMQAIASARFYRRAQWWRSLNRAMSIVGLFVVGAVVALIVTGVRQQWKP